MNTNMYVWSYLTQLFLEWETFPTEFVEKIQTLILRSVTFFFPRKSCRFWDDEKKYCGAGQATNDIMAHAHFMMDT